MLTWSDIEDTGSVSTELDSLSVNVDNSCGKLESNLFEQIYLSVLLLVVV